MELSNDRIREILPHRYPFLMLDRITDYVPGQWAEGIKCVSAGEGFFVGHFPQKSVMPGVLILEAIAQTGAIAILTEPENAGKIAVLGKIKNARFRRQVLPGDVLILECRLTSRRGPVGIGEGSAKIGDDVVCEAEFTFAITDAQ